MHVRHVEMKQYVEPCSIEYLQHKFIVDTCVCEIEREKKKSS